MPQYLTLCQDDFTRIRDYLLSNNVFLDGLGTSLPPRLATTLPPELENDEVADLWVDVLCQPLHRGCIGGGPGLVDDTISTFLDEAILIDVIANDSPSTRNCLIDSTTLVISTPPVNGTAVVQNGEVLYTPNMGFVGADNFEYQVFDDCLMGDTARVDISVLPNNLPPVCTDGTVIMTENEFEQTDLTQFITVGSGAIDTFVIIDGPLNGVASINPDDTLDYTPTADFVGYDYVDVEVTDVNGLSCIFELLFHIQPRVVSVPIAPDFEIILPYNTVNNLINIAAVVTTDPNCTHTATSVVSSTENGSLIVDGLNLRYSNTESWTGTDTLEYRITDGCGQSATGTITIQVQTPGVQVASCATLNGLDCQYLTLTLEDEFVCAGATIVYLASNEDCDNVRAIQVTPQLITGNIVFFRLTNELPFGCNDNPVSIACV